MFRWGCIFALSELLCSSNNYYSPYIHTYVFPTIKKITFSEISIQVNVANKAEIQVEFMVIILEKCMLKYKEKTLLLLQ